jgi:DNA polymerase III alpha subunit
MRALEILDMTKHIPHVTRGSCGSSLVCYLVGISHVDPIKYNIKFSRFLNIYRNNLPDIDFDFPYNMRDEVFLNYK